MFVRWGVVAFPCFAKTGVICDGINHTAYNTTAGFQTATVTCGEAVYATSDVIFHRNVSCATVQGRDYDTALSLSVFLGLL